MSKKVLLREYYSLCPDGMCQIPNLTPEEKQLKEEGKMLLVGKLQEGDVKNGNGRIYPTKFLKREMDLYQKAIRERRAVGTLDHEDSDIISLKEASHRILRIWWDGPAVFGVLQVLSTPNGQTLKALIDDKVQVGISSRALGSLNEAQGAMMVNEDLELICFDIVQQESCPGSSMHLMEHYDRRQFFTKADRINRQFYKILKK